MDNSEALSMMLKGMDFDAKDLIRVVSALGEIKKKKEEKDRKNIWRVYKRRMEKTLEIMLKASLLKPLVEAKS